MPSKQSAGRGCSAFLRNVDKRVLQATRRHIPQLQGKNFVTHELSGLREISVVIGIVWAYIEQSNSTKKGAVVCQQ
jgi:hypothetical protein